MDATVYDAWYDAPKGQWIGNTEFVLMRRLLSSAPGTRLLDVGCGTGWFTRRFVGLPYRHVTGLDVDLERLRFAKNRDAGASYLAGDALGLPFSDGCFDEVVSVTALCFIEDWHGALKEIVRVARQRFVVGVLNRNSLLWQAKGRGGGAGGYRGAYWHTPHELREALSALPVQRIRLDSAVFMPSGSCFARLVEDLLPTSLLLGGFLVLSGEKCH